MTTISRDLSIDFDKLLEDLQRDDDGRYSLTLLHKTDGSIYCFLSDRLQGVDSEETIPVGATLGLSKKRRDIQVHYDVAFHKRDTGDGFYFVLESDTPFDRNRELIVPFNFEDDPPYAVVSKGLKQKLGDYMSMRANRDIEMLEHIGQHGLLKTFFNRRFRREIKKKYASIRETEQSLKTHITDLFREHTSPSTILHPFKYLNEDKGKRALFVKQEYKNFLCVFPLITFIPYKPVINALNDEFTAPFELKFKLMKSKEEEQRVLLSDFAYSHPKAKEGVIRAFESVKHAANFTTYAGFAGLTVLAHKYAPWWASYPMTAVSSLSGLTMLYNVIRSRGRDSSGVISTFLGSLVPYNKLD